jgi:UDP-2,3-diacylglucosamine pyrophosphatase LpxH
LRTAIVSDMHLGNSFGEDVLRDQAVRTVLFDELASADRVVLLGDTIEMRERPLPPVLNLAQPFFEELGETLAGREVLLIPGNHDHRLAESLLETVAEESDGSLGAEQTAAAAAEPATRIDRWLGDARLRIAYPGAWLRDDVYVTHGHYVDCHMTLPRIECVAAAAVMRAFGPIPDRAEPVDYERVLRPIYGLAFGLAQAGFANPDLVQRTRPSELAWRAILDRRRGRGRARRVATRAAIGAGVPAGVWAINRLLRARFEADISPTSITRSGIEAGVEMERRLQLGAEHVIVGHTHRAGPRADEPAWKLAGGGHLHNTGSWVFASAFHRPGTPPGPYWPGTVTWLEEQGPPRRVSLLADHSGEALHRIVRRQEARPATRR